MTLLLFSVWSIPGMTAVRHLLLFGAWLSYLAAGMWRCFPDVLKAFPRVYGMLALLSGWFVFQAIVISPEPNWALGELRGQWLIALIAFGLGMLFGAERQTSVELQGNDQAKNFGRKMTTLIFAILFAETLVTDAIAIAHFGVDGTLLKHSVPLTGGKLEMSFLLNILLAILAVDMFFRGTARKPLLRVPFSIVLLSLAATLFGIYVCSARNGVIGCLFLIASIAFLFIHQNRRNWSVWQIAAIALLSLLTIFSFGVINYKGDARWTSFTESAVIGWETANNPRWIDPSFSTPTMSNGQLVDDSAYRRVLYIHGGLSEIQQHPLGVGYGRNAFSHALRQHQPNVLAGHSHSGFVDLGIAGGYPALALWVLFIVSIGFAGAQSYFRDGNAHGLLLLFLVAGYTGRMVLDSVNRDHMLQMFFFLAAYLLTRIFHESVQSVRKRVRLSPCAGPD